jgi:hypothetical protein
MNFIFHLRPDRGLPNIRMNAKEIDVSLCEWAEPAYDNLVSYDIAVCGGLLPESCLIPCRSEVLRSKASEVLDHIPYARSEDFTAVKMSVVIFFFVSCSSVGCCQFFGGLLL